MKIRAVEKYLTRLLQVYCDPHYGEPRLSPAFGVVPLLSGPPGIGKTSIIRQVVRKFVASQDFPHEYMAQFMGSVTPSPTRIVTETGSFGLNVVELAQMEEPDVRGFALPRKVNMPDGREIRVSEYTCPPLVEYGDAPTCGVMAFDELGQVSHSMQSASASMLLEARAGDYTSGWLRWAATNSVKHSSGVKPLLGHYRNRTQRIEVEPDADSLVAFGASIGIPPLALAFVPFAPAVVFTDEVPRDESPFCSPRSFVKGMQQLQFISNDPERLRTDPEASELLAGHVGTAAAAQIMKFMELGGELASIDEIIAKPDSIKIPSTVSTRYAYMGMVIHHVNDDNVGPLLKFMQRLPKEMQITIVMAMYEKARDGLFQTTEFANWVQRNADIVVAVQSME